MVTEKQGRWKIFKKKLNDKYRMVIMNDSTFERKLSFRLSRLNVFVAVGTLSIILIIITIFIVAYTPLREYIPGYGDVNLQRDVYTLSLRADSLEAEIVRRNLFLTNLQYIIEGKDIPQNNLNPELDTAVSKYKDLDFSISHEDSMLREEFESIDKYNLTFSNESENRSTISGFFFFAPVKGIVVNGFNPSKDHYGIDLAAAKNDAVKSTLDGTVVLTGWTLETGYVIAVQHSYNIISVYKHNSVLLKRMGDYVKAGEPIAIIGDSGEMTTGPHLHFEIWYNGKAVNPRDYILF